MHRDTARGWLKHGNPPGDPASAPRCGAQTRRHTPLPGAGDDERPLSDAWRLSTGPTTLEGVHRLRAARTKSGRFSAEGRAMAAWHRRYVANGYRSIRALVRALGAGTIRDQAGGRWDAEAYLCAIVDREAAEGLAPAMVEAERQAVRAAIADRDVRRLRAKGFLRAA